MQLAYQQFDLPLRHVFTISRGSTSVQSTLVVQLSVENIHGYGEATTNSFYGATIENMSASLESVRSLVEGTLLDDPLELIATLARKLPGQEFALSALDQAIHDLWGKLRGKPVYELWGLTTDKIPVSDYTLGIDAPEKMVAKMREMPGWPVYKIKLGTADDLAIVRELRRHTDAVFRVDANCGWTPGQTIELAPVLAELGVEFIEQPIAPGNDAAARQAREGSALPLFADESCVTEADVDRCAGLFDGINIKLVKCGGLAAARRMIARARELGPKGDGRLHDRVDGRYLGVGATVATLGPCRHGRGGPVGPRHRHRSPARKGPLHLPEHQWHRRHADRRPAAACGLANTQ